MEKEPTVLEFSDTLTPEKALFLAICFINSTTFLKKNFLRTKRKPNPLGNKHFILLG